MGIGHLLEVWNIECAQDKEDIVCQALEKELEQHSILAKFGKRGFIVSVLLDCDTTTGAHALSLWAAVKKVAGVQCRMSLRYLPLDSSNEYHLPSDSGVAKRAQW